MFVNVHHDGAPFAVLLDVGLVRVLLPPMLVGPPPYNLVGDKHIWQWMWELAINMPIPEWHIDAPYTRAQVDDIMAELSAQLGVTLQPPPVDTIPYNDIETLSAEQGIICLGDLVCVAGEWGVVPKTSIGDQDNLRALAHDLVVLTFDLGVALWQDDDTP